MFNPREKERGRHWVLCSGKAGVAVWNRRCVPSPWHPRPGPPGPRLPGGPPPTRSEEPRPPAVRGFAGLSPGRPLLRKGPQFFSFSLSLSSFLLSSPSLSVRSKYPLVDPALSPFLCALPSSPELLSSLLSREGLLTLSLKERKIRD